MSTPRLILTASFGWAVARPDGRNWRTNPGGHLIYGSTVLKTADLPPVRQPEPDAEADARLEYARELTP